MSHLKGFQKPVIATPAALWILKGLLVLVSLVLVIRACTTDEGSVFSLAKEWAAEEKAPASSLPPPVPSTSFRVDSSQRFVKIPRGTHEVILTIQKDKWSSWITLPENVRFSADVPAPVEYEFWGGKRIQTKTIDDHLGTIPDATFRVRGADGEMRMYLQ